MRWRWSTWCEVGGEYMYEVGVEYMYEVGWSTCMRGRVEHML